MGGGVGYFYFIIKGKITLSFASPEKEKYLFYIYEVITWENFHKEARIYYSPQSLHVLLTRLCSQMEAPPQSLQTLLRRLCSQMEDRKSVV